MAVGEKGFGSSLYRRSADMVMNGRVFQWDKVRKNKALGVFEEIA